VFYSRLLALLANIKLGCKGVPGTNTLTFVNNGRKKFCNIGPWRSQAKQRSGEDWVPASAATGSARLGFDLKKKLKQSQFFEV
jgi:hypothetical protein